MPSECVPQLPPSPPQKAKRGGPMGSELRNSIDVAQKNSGGPILDWITWRKAIVDLRYLPVLDRSFHVPEGIRYIYYKKFNFKKDVQKSVSSTCRFDESKWKGFGTSAGTPSRQSVQMHPARCDRECTDEFVPLGGALKVGTGALFVIGAQHFPVFYMAQRSFKIPSFCTRL